MMVGVKRPGAAPATLTLSPMGNVSGTTPPSAELYAVVTRAMRITGVSWRSPQHGATQVDTCTLRLNGADSGVTAVVFDDTDVGTLTKSVTASLNVAVGDRLAVQIAETVAGETVGWSITAEFT